VQWRKYEPRRSTTDLDEMAEDSVDLGGVCDDGENPHAVSTARTDEGALAVSGETAAALGIIAVDLCDEARPCGGGAPILDRLGAPGGMLAIRRCLGQRRGCFDQAIICFSFVSFQSLSHKDFRTISFHSLDISHAKILHRYVH
jgi:hypothetical protein